MDTVVDVKERQKAQWGAAARAWDHWFDWYSRAFAPMIEWCADAVNLAPGSRVLDVASGSGQPAFTEAMRVRPGGTVTAIDISPEMVSLARERARAAGLDNLQFLEIDAEQLPFEAESFDAVTCTCGLMFFPDATGALGQMRRVLKPGGQIAIAVWDDPSKSPFLTVGGQAVGQFFPPSPPDPNAPGAFRLSRPGELERVLGAAGFREVKIESVVMPIEVASGSEYWQLFTDMAAGIKDKIDTLPSPDRARLREMVMEAANRHVQNGRLRLAATPLCASARK